MTRPTNGIRASAERCQIVARRTEIDREPERVEAGEIRGTGRGCEGDDGKAVEPVDSYSIQHHQHNDARHRQRYPAFSTRVRLACSGLYGRRRISAVSWAAQLASPSFVPLSQLCLNRLAGSPLIITLSIQHASEFASKKALDREDSLLYIALNNERAHK